MKMSWDLSISRTIVRRTPAARLPQSIAKRAFEGKLVPQDPNDEPASELLARIRGAQEKEQMQPKLLQ